MIQTDHFKTGKHIKNGGIVIIFKKNNQQPWCSGSKLKLSKINEEGTNTPKIKLTPVIAAWDYRLTCMFSITI